MSFEGKRVIVTGAGKGIGRVTAEMLVQRGAHVVALTRSAADVASLQDELGCQAIQVDLADADRTREAAIAALPADYLVNCAGTTELQSFLDTTVEAFDRLHAVNTRAPMIVAQEEAMEGQDFWALKPLILAGDAGAIRARRILRKLIRKEQEAAA